MVTVPIPFIFGTIFVLNMLQGSLFAKLTQPLKGVLNTVAAAIIWAALFALMYRALAPTVTGKLDAGPAGLSVGNLAGFGAAGGDVPVPGGLRGLLHHVAAAARQSRASDGNRGRALIYLLACESDLLRPLLSVSAISAFGQTPPPAPAPSPAPSYARAAQLPARIEKFTATA